MSCFMKIMGEDIIWELFLVIEGVEVKILFLFKKRNIN